MKRKLLYIFLAAEAAALLLINACSGFMPGVFSSLFAFPFEQIGLILRALSLSGRIGNGLAVLLWAGISLLPLMLALKNSADAKKKWENVVLYVLSLCLFVVLYCMAEPSFVTASLEWASADILPVLKGMLGCSVWAVVVLYIVLRLLRLFKNGERPRLLAYLRGMLFAVCALFVGGIAGECFSGMLSALSSAQNGADTAFAIIGFAMSALPYVTDILVTLSALTLLEKLIEENREEAVLEAERLSRLCCTALALVTACGAGYNYLQLLFMRRLSNVSVTVAIPLMSLAFTLAALLLARLIAENRRLNDDMDLFV